MQPPIVNLGKFITNLDNHNLKFVFILVLILCWTFDFGGATRNILSSLISKRLDIVRNLHSIILGICFFQATIAGGGVIPHIHKSLINKSTKGKKAKF